MRERPLGSTGIQLPCVTFGAWALGGWAWGGAEDDRSLEALRAGFDAGMTAVDTAPMYGFGRSEEVVGRALAGRREEVRVLTKVGLRWDDGRGELFFETAGPDGKGVRVHRNSRPDSVRLEVERSLKRLGVERLDLVQVHWPDPTTPIAATMGALLELRSEGKLEAIGVSNYSVEQCQEARAALGDVPLAANQVRYSLLTREIEGDVLPWCADAGVGVLAYSPLEQGLLTGAVGPERRFPPDDIRARSPLFSVENRRAVLATLERAVAPIALRHGATLVQVVLAWTAQREGVTSVLAGARDVEQARENAAAGALILSEEERAAIDAAFGGGGAEG